MSKPSDFLFNISRQKHLPTANSLQNKSDPLVFRKGVKPINAHDEDSGSDYNIFDDVEDEEVKLSKANKVQPLKEVPIKSEEQILEQNEEMDQFESNFAEAPSTIEVLQHKRHTPIARNDIQEEEKFDAVEEDEAEFLSNDEKQDEDQQNQNEESIKSNDNDNDHLENNEQESENESQSQTKMFKPEFIAKENRKSDGRFSIENHEKDKFKKIKSETAVFIKNSKNIIENIDLMRNNEETDIGDADFDENDESEYDKWRVRELTRIKRNEEDRKVFQNIKIETERRKKMTDEQIVEENKAIGRYDRPMKSSYQYMQKYYTGFTFYQNSEDPIFKRDYNIATGFDTYDKASAPEILQVRGNEYGKKGRSKYKDLVSEDTNVFECNWRENEFLARKVKNKLGGFKTNDTIFKQKK